MKEKPDQKKEEVDKVGATNDENQSNAYWLDQLGILTGKKSFWNSNKLLSLLAFLISIGTFTTFAYQTYLIQKQQYASVLPYLMIQPYNDGSGEYTTRELRLRNNGVGPAFIRSVKTYYQDSVYSQDPSQFYFKSIDHPDSTETAVNNESIFPGYVIPPGKNVLLIGSASEYSANTIAKYFTSQKAVFEIDYSSIYDEVWRIRSDDPIPEKIE